MNLEESNSMDWEVLAKYIAGEMEDDENQEFKKRLDFSEYNKKLVQQVKSDWEIMENYKKDKEFDAGKAWDKLHSKFEMEGLLDNVKPSEKSSNFRILLRIAAVLIIGVLFATVAYYLITDNSKTSWMVADTYQSNSNSKIILSDGSIVYLNANSKLYYPEKFDEKSRTIEFEGDAFFEITKNPQKPFVIKAKDSEIRVLGTSFNVNTNLVSKDIEVLVATGKVKLSSLEHKNVSIVLEPGFIGSINKNNISKKLNTDKNYLSWKTKIFDFTENINLGEAVDILNRAFHANIRCEGDVVYNKKLNSTFTSEDSLDKILNLICDSQGVRRQQKNNEIILSIN